MSLPSDEPECHLDFAELDASILHLEREIALDGNTGTDNADGNASSHSWRRLGDHLWRRFQLLHKYNDLDKAIQAYALFSSRIPDTDEEVARRITALATAFSHRFDEKQEVKDLDEAINAWRLSIKLSSHEGTRQTRLQRLASALLSRVMHSSGDSSDISHLEECIDTSVELLTLSVDDSDDFRSLAKKVYSTAFTLNDFNSLVILGHSVMLQSQIQSNEDGLIAASHILEKAIELGGADHDLSSVQHNYGKALHLVYKRNGKVDPLYDGIDCLEMVCNSTPNGHADRALRINTYSAALVSEYKVIANVQSLDKAIGLLEKVISRDGAGIPFPEFWPNLSTLGNALLEKYLWEGDISYLNRSITEQEYAHSLVPEGNREKPMISAELALALRHRFARLPVKAELNKSIELTRIGLKMVGNREIDLDVATMWDRLGEALLERFKRFGDSNDLKECIDANEAAKEALDYIFGEDDHPQSLPPVEHHLGQALFTRHLQSRNNHQDLERSIYLFQQSAIGTSNADPIQGILRRDLGRALLARFEYQKDMGGTEYTYFCWPGELGLTGDDLEDGTINLKHCNDILPENHPALVHSFITLGEIACKRIQSDPLNANLLDEATNYFHSATRVLSGHPSQRFQAAVRWMSLAFSKLSSSPMSPGSDVKVDLTAPKAAMAIIPSLVWLGSPLTERHYQVQQVGDVVRDGARLAILAKEFDLAVEWLEQGRSVVWNQMLQLRSPLDDLREADHLRGTDYATELESVSRLLEGSQTDSENLHSINYHDLAQQREELLIQIRNFPGFERFLMQESISKLRCAAELGPIVLLNLASGVNLDALIILNPTDPIIHVALPGTLPQHADIIPSKKILASLWRVVAQPILERLNVTVGTTKILSELSEGEQASRRIWWCTTGPLSFYPIHAAGIYDDPANPKLSDYYISSYTTTISALLNARKPVERHGPLTILTVCLPEEADLPWSEKEVKQVNFLAKHAKLGRRRLWEEKATAHAVSEALTSCQLAHISCHCEQNGAESCLHLAGQSRLTLVDLTRQQKGRDLIFLSGCETAKPDAELADESLHLAAGMVFAGYRGVIATTRRVPDSYSCAITNELYTRLFLQYQADPTKAAVALHFAIEAIREEHPTCFDWVLFIHMGI